MTWKKKFTPITVKIPGDKDAELWLTALEAEQLVQKLQRELTAYRALRELKGVRVAQIEMGKRPIR